MQIFPEDNVDENFFDIYYHPYKKQIWGVGAALAIVVVAFLGLRQYRKTRLDEQWSRYDAAIEISGPRLPGQTPEDEANRQIDALRTLARDYPDDTVTPFALKGIVDAQVAAGKYADALSTLEELQQRFPDFALFTIPAEGADSKGSLADHLRGTLESERTWRTETSYEHTWPDTDRIACVDTTMGTFWLGFYDEAAPRHVAAFIENAKAGVYNGTQVYDVRRGADGSPQLFAAGSRASKTARDPADHDRDEPADTIEPEYSRCTIHDVQRVASAVEMDSGESRTAFQVITSETGMVDRFFGRTSPFAAVLDRGDSLDVIARISRAPTYETNPETASADGIHRMRDHPYPPIYIRRVTILRDERPEDGHTFDTANYGKDVAEAWEATLPPPPRPEEFVEPETPAPGSGGDTQPDDGATPPDDDQGTENAGDGSENTE
mgnify:CR=1 FL=1